MIANFRGDIMKTRKNHEPINILYSLSDKKGTYSKYIGTSMYSVLENTNSKIVFYLFHDGSLSDENKKKFNKLVQQYNSQIKYINIRSVAGDKCNKARSVFTHAMQEEARYPEAAMYRLMAPQILKDIKRLIYLDADTIVNLDIEELWRYELNDSGIGAVLERELLKNYGQSRGSDIDTNLAEKIILRMDGVDLANVFNSGVLLMDLEILRKMGDLLIPGMKFLAKYPGEAKFYDQDILNYYFAGKCTNLPWKYNVLIHWDKLYSDKVVKKAIYHYMGHTLEMNPKSNYDILFYDYFIKTPWFNGEFFCKALWIEENIIKNKISPILCGMQKLNRCLFEKRMVIAYTNEKIEDVALFISGMEEMPTKDIAENVIKDFQGQMVVLGNDGENISLPYDLSDNIYVIFAKDYKKIKGIMLNAGLIEYQHFVDGMILEKKEKWLKDRINQGLFFSVL